MNKQVAQLMTHAVVACEDCDFKASWYLDAIDKGSEHHQETGHELIGEIGLSVWIGAKGQSINDSRNACFDEAFGLGECQPG